MNAYVRIFPKFRDIVTIILSECVPSFYLHRVNSVEQKKKKKKALYKQLHLYEILCKKKKKKKQYTFESICKNIRKMITQNIFYHAHLLCVCRGRYTDIDSREPISFTLHGYLADFNNNPSPFVVGLWWV